MFMSLNGGSLGMHICDIVHQGISSTGMSCIQDRQEINNEKTTDLGNLKKVFQEISPNQLGNVLS